MIFLKVPFEPTDTERNCQVEFPKMNEYSEKDNENIKDLISRMITFNAQERLTLI